MKNKYTIIREDGEKWISKPFNAGELEFDHLEIVEELNMLLSRNKQLEQVGDEMRAWCNDKRSCEQWDKIKEEN